MKIELEKCHKCGEEPQFCPFNFDENYTYMIACACYEGLEDTIFEASENNTISLHSILNLFDRWRKENKGKIK